MKKMRVVGGAVLVILGVVWLLQGLNIIPGSFMTGQQFWAWAGITTLVAGIVLTYIGLRSGKRKL